MSKEFTFRHQRLDVYQVALEVVRCVEELDSGWFRGNCDRRRQLARAADSVVLNIAEGCARGAGRAEKNHYRIAMGSAGECDAILQLMEIRRAPVHQARQRLARVGAMLCRMV